MKALKDFLRRSVYGAIHVCSPRKAILFESIPDCSDNTKAVFDEMLRRGMNKKYDLIWVLHSEKTPREEIPHVQYLKPGGKGLKNRLRIMGVYARAKCMICCNGFLLPQTAGQVSFYLAHGTPMKQVRHYYTMPDDIDYCLSAAPGVEKMTAYQFNADENKMFSLGYPRNDVFSGPAAQVKEMLGTSCKKVVVWYPTFRQHNNGRKTGSDKALPVIHDTDAARELNDWANKLDVLIVLKPHFAQDLKSVKDLHLSNIRFIDEDFFEQNHISSYEFVGSCDALITDYSSIYYDFTLCNKPIGLVWEDLEEYRREPGFAVDVEEYGRGGAKIYTLSDFIDFLRDVSEDKDTCREAREQLRDLVNYSDDGKNAQRVVDFIIEKSGLRGE